MPDNYTPATVQSVDSITLPDLLPPNATPLERAAIRAALAQFSALPVNVCRALWNPGTCPLELLPWLAWTFGLETWSDTWSEAIKRARVRNAIEIARKRGTVGSVRRALESYGGTFVLTEWWQTTPRGIPHTFHLLMVLSGQDGQAATAEFLESVLHDIDRTKPLRSHYTVTQGLATTGSIRVLTIARVLLYRRLHMQVQ